MTSMGFGINLQGIADKVYAQVVAELPSRAYRAAHELRNAELEILAGQRSGRTYRTPGGGTYTASAPGEPPAVRTNTLRGKFREMTYGVNGRNPGIENSPAAQYAGYMENGTPGGMIKPRPFVNPIIEKAKPAIEAIYKEPFHISP